MPLQLLKEAVDQLKKGHHSKLHCLDYFILIHIETQPIKYNQAYVELISNVVGE